MISAKNDDAQSKIEFPVCYYVPFSFVLFLVALTFPLRPSVDDIATYNLWLQCLLQIMPLQVRALDLLAQKLEANNQPAQPLFTSRKQFIALVFSLHELVTGETLHAPTVFKMFAALRANDCGGASFESNSRLASSHHDTSPKNEASCTRKMSNSVSVVCAIAVSREQVPSSFLMDGNVRPTDYPPNIDVVHDAFTNERSFCSCIFSVKWFLLHMLAFAYEPSKRDVHHIFLQLFGRVLACNACRHNFDKNLEQAHFSVSHDLHSRRAYREFVYRLHNHVNAMLAKPQAPPSLDEHLQFFQTLQRSTTPHHFCSIVITDEKHAKKRFYFLE